MSELLEINECEVWFSSSDKCNKVSLDFSVVNPPVLSDKYLLLLFEFDGEVDLDLVRSAGISRSGVGFYISKFCKDQVVTFEKDIPEGLSLSRVGLRSWGGGDIYINLIKSNLFMESQSSECLSEIFIDAFASKLSAHDGGLIVNLNSHSENCSNECQGFVNRWHSSMERQFQRNSKLSIKKEILTGNGVDAFCVSSYEALPSCIRFDGDLTSYRKLIGDSSRNMVKKASLSGYAISKIDLNNYLNDVYEIRTSSPTRQGLAIPSYFYEKLTSYNLPSTCAVHCSYAFGAFLNGKLCAYVTLFRFGELLQVNHILVHESYKRSGVMNLLVHDVVAWIYENLPEVRALNYLYQVGDPSKGLNRFKNGLGFRSTNLFVCNVKKTSWISLCEVIESIKNNNDSDRGKLSNSTVKTTSKINKKLFHVASEDYFVVDDVWLFLSGLISEGFTYSKKLEFVCHRAIFDIDGGKYKDVFGRNLKIISSLICLEDEVVLYAPGIFSSVDDENSAYFERRLKGQPLSGLNVRELFKGSDFVVFKFVFDSSNAAIFLRKVI